VDPVRFPLPLSSDVEPALFLQRAGRTVLMGYRESGCWVLARGWRRGDRFTDIRCWRFRSPDQFVVQVGRLVREEGAPDLPGDAVTAAGQWVRQALPR
jgi:hypothetical protein